jgi:hypothetical protein
LPNQYVVNVTDKAMLGMQLPHVNEISQRILTAGRLAGPVLIVTLGGMAVD